MLIALSAFSFDLFLVTEDVKICTNVKESLQQQR